MTAHEEIITAIFELKNMYYTKEKIAIWSKMLNKYPAEILRAVMDDIVLNSGNVDYSDIANACELKIKLARHFMAMKKNKQISFKKYCDKCKYDTEHDELLGKYFYCKVCGHEFGGMGIDININYEVNKI